MNTLIETLQRAGRHSAFPIILLVLINLAVGLLTYGAYGLSWDEPLFYDYADSITLAYTPQAFSPAFDFEQVYGPSAADHKYYGPAYLLAARPLQQALMALLGADRASAWHLVNFLTFQVGLIFFYLLLRRWFDPWPAAAATALFAWQPVIWGHAFINPKDMPFMVFFIAAIVLGFRMVDSLTPGGGDKRRSWGLILLAGIVLGATAAVRVIGPLAGAVVAVYFVLQKNWRSSFPAFFAYGLIAILTMFAAWPFLWADPLNRLLEVTRHMSNNPTELAVLFMGQIFRANEMPRRYLPQLLALTLSEPVWILFATGLIVAIRNVRAGKIDWRAPLVVLGIFVFMLAYLLYNQPSMYDGFRHFFFILPPVFATAGFALQFLYDRLRARLLWAATIVLVLLPGLLGMLQLHPYEYAYYNRLAGGTGGAYRVYETEYWLTCYKESLEWLRANAAGSTIHVQREFPLAEYYGQGLALKDLTREPGSDVRPGDLLLFSTRANLDIRSTYRNLPVIQSIGRAGAEFCLIKEKR